MQRPDRMSLDRKTEELHSRIECGGEAKYHRKDAEKGKLFVRERIARLADPASFVEDAALANNHTPELPADGVVTGTARVAGRTVAIAANDSTVKAGLGERAASRKSCASRRRLQGSASR